MNIKLRVALKLAAWTVLGISLITAIAIVSAELRSSDMQAKYLSEIAGQLEFHVEPGPSPAIRYPGAGPYDQRLGYTQLQRFQQRLQNQGYVVESQARISPMYARMADSGFNLPYFEKAQAGVKILNRDESPMYQSSYPAHVYDRFEDIPPIVLKTLLFIENRELLDETYPHRNPAVEWDRFGYAGLQLVARKLGSQHRAPGGSTLATQIEKYRHSPGGLTDSPSEKLRQMGSASVRAYLLGEDTLQARRGIALTYMNSMPLAATLGNGEVQGLGDGLWAWYGANFDAVNELLMRSNVANGESVTPEQARAYRQVLCLLLSQRRPSYYLMGGREDLEKLADSHLRLLADQHVISAAMRDAALQVPIDIVDLLPSAPQSPFAQHKTEAMLRTQLANVLGVERLYDLDRLDMSARATLDQTAQQGVVEALRKLREPDAARAAGVLGFRLLNTDSDFEKIVYSLILFEKTPQGNLLRVQADNYDEPLDINDGIRLDLGSTAKLRTLVHYLEIIAELHHRYSGQARKALGQIGVHPRDHLTRWVIDELIANEKLSLPDLLQAALDRKYSAGPGEAFYTGGGLHTFVNFNKDDNGRIMPVRVALQQSVNLVFIRMMRDIAYHHLYKEGGVARWLETDNGEKRREYLERFADQEGKAYLRRFYGRYHGKTPDEALEIITKNTAPFAHKLTTVYRSIYPSRGVDALRAYLKSHLAAKGLSDEDVAALYDKYGPDRFDLHDRGYIARAHPLELWLLEYLAQHPEASLKEVYAASAQERIQVYRWLFKSTRRYAQEKRIWTLLEREAFAKIHAAWQRLGFPFETMTPSYASAIGASGDRPAALAELVGIIMNEGQRYPTARFDHMHFASGTPYETVMGLPSAKAEQVLEPEVARAARAAMIEVVERGTAVRLRGAYKGPDNTPLVVAGKTGTGDHQREIFGPRGRLIASQVVSRTATFTFMLGDKLFGALTAYVTGPAAAHFKFTSALPVQVLRSLEPTLRPLVAKAYGRSPQTVAARGSTVN